MRPGQLPDGYTSRPQTNYWCPRKEDKFLPIAKESNDVASRYERLFMDRFEGKEGAKTTDTEPELERAAGLAQTQLTERELVERVQIKEGITINNIHFTPADLNGLLVFVRGNKT